MLGASDFFDLDGFEHAALFDGTGFVWEALPKLKTYLKEKMGSNLSKVAGGMLAQTLILWEGEIISEEFEIVPGDATKGTLQVKKEGKLLEGASVLYAGAFLFDAAIRIGRGSVVEPGALIKGPTIIGNNTEVRQGTYVRGNCLIGDRCVVGHTTEAKSLIMLNDAKAGHFAYLGDSILGNSVNLGAGTKLANLKIIDGDVTLRVNGKTYPTGLRKLGAILGDQSETGCNAVTSPGTLLGKKSLVFPCVNPPGGYYPERSVIGLNTKKMLNVRQMRSRS